MHRQAAPQDLVDHDLPALICAARDGHGAAWTRLIERFDPMLRRIAGSYRLSQADVDEVAQIAWVRLYEHLATITEPKAVGGWLATTARRESMRVLQSHVRERLTATSELTTADARLRPEAELLAAEERLVLGRALASLSGRERRLLTLLAAEPDASYDRISTALQMPVGSIGPTRARGMARLERHPELRGHRALAG
jgi:RNA polymerase sigma factor (sigma-70 family)